ncbi:hypothetical protein N752_12210 [Desulforamulus aquiferis]|nr:hypothetical protein N752_12210 [Desulforamulus aquiferis]
MSLMDESGKTILNFIPAKDYQSIVISTPELQQGKTYTLYSGGSLAGNSSDGLYIGASYSPGTEIVKVTISGTITSISDTGDQITSMGGPGGMGGPRRGTPPVTGTVPVTTPRPHSRS